MLHITRWGRARQSRFKEAFFSKWKTNRNLAWIRISSRRRKQLEPGGSLGFSYNKVSALLGRVSLPRERPQRALTAKSSATQMAASLLVPMGTWDELLANIISTFLCLRLRLKHKALRLALDDARASGSFHKVRFGVLEPILCRWTLRQHSCASSTHGVSWIGECSFSHSSLLFSGFQVYSRW